jgi:hypothetical protein
MPRIQGPRRGTRARLAVRAMTDRRLLRIGFGFNPDVAAVARAVDFHDLSPKLRRRRSLPQQEFARCTLDHRRSANLTAKEAGFAGYL